MEMEGASLRRHIWHRMVVVGQSLPFLWGHRPPSPGRRGRLEHHSPHKAAPGGDWAVNGARSAQGPRQGQSRRGGGEGFCTAPRSHTPRDLAPRRGHKSRMSSPEHLPR
jgi:hypothetical protein